MAMSKKQLETFFEKAVSNKNIQSQVDACGSNNSCIAEVGQRFGYKFSPATLSHWQRDH
tara:strand:- start:303 stop:479 length:177 start_codon:yes stop_codon:yes gene_type:complete